MSQRQTSPAGRDLSIVVGVLQSVAAASSIASKQPPEGMGCMTLGPFADAAWLASRSHPLLSLPRLASMAGSLEREPLARVLQATTASHHLSPAPPQPNTTTALHRHSPAPPPPCTTTSLLHHSPSPRSSPPPRVLQAKAFCESNSADIFYSSGNEGLSWICFEGSCADLAQQAWDDAG